MKEFDPKRNSFTVTVEMDIATRNTDEHQARLQLRDLASANNASTQVTEEAYRSAVSEGKAFFICLQPLWWTGFEIIRINVAFSKCTFKSDSILCTSPTSNPFVEPEVYVPVIFEKGLAYCDLTELQETLKEYYVR